MSGEVVVVAQPDNAKAYIDRVYRQQEQDNRLLKTLHEVLTEHYPGDDTEAKIVAIKMRKKLYKAGLISIVQ